MSFRFEETDLGEDAHPNTARLTMGNGERTVQVTGVSIGGGLVEITNVNGYDVSFGCEYDTLLVLAEDRPGTINEVTGWLARQGINIAFLRVERQKRGGDAIMIIETDHTVDPQILEAFEDYLWVRWARQVPKVECDRSADFGGRSGTPAWRMAGGILHRGDLEHNFVEHSTIASPPRLIGLDDGVAGVVRVFGGVPVRAVVATADVSADHAAT